MEQPDLEEAFNDHLDAVYNYCFRRAGSWSTAEDLTGTVFLEAWRSRGRAPRDQDNLLPWLYGIASNVIRHHQRSFVRRSRAVRRLQAGVGHDLGQSDLVDEIASHDWLMRALQTLPARDQDAFVLVCWQDLTYRQAASALAVPVGTVRSRVYRARQNLQRSHRDLTTGDQSPADTTTEVLR